MADMDMLQAAKSGDAKRVKVLIAEDPACIHVKDEDGNGPLHLAAIANYHANSGHFEVVKRLVRAGADVNAPGFEDNIGQAPPVVLAAFSSPNNIETVRLLLRRGANPNGKSSKGHTPLLAAAEHGAHEICDILLEKKATLDIHSAAALGKRLEARKMLREDPDLVLDRDDYRRATPLYYAALQNQRDLAELLLSYEANLSAQTVQGDTAMHAAAAAPSRRTLEYLIEQGGDVNARNYKMQTPLHFAVEEWWAEGSEVMHLLILHGANVHLRDENKQTPLVKAMQRNKTELVSILKKAGARE